MSPYEIRDEFVSREFNFDDNFKSAIKMLVSEAIRYQQNEDTRQAVSSGIDIMLDKGFSFNHCLEWDISLEQQLLNDNNLSSIYLNKKLIHELQEKPKSSKILKI